MRVYQFRHPGNILFSKKRRPGRESHPRITLLQRVALLLGYQAFFINIISYFSRSSWSIFCRFFSPRSRAISRKGMFFIFKFSRRYSRSSFLFLLANSSASFSFSSGRTVIRIVAFLRSGETLAEVTVRSEVELLSRSKNKAESSLIRFATFSSLRLIRLFLHQTERFNHVARDDLDLRFNQHSKFRSFLRLAYLRLIFFQIDNFSPADLKFPAQNFNRALELNPPFHDFAPDYLALLGAAESFENFRPPG